MDLRAAFLVLSIEPTDAVSDDARASIPVVAAPDYPRDRLMAALSVSLSVTKRTVLDDLARFESAPAGAGAFDAWLSATAERYRQWIARPESQCSR